MKLKSKAQIEPKGTNLNNAKITIFITIRSMMNYERQRKSNEFISLLFTIYRKSYVIFCNPNIFHQICT